ncbi:MAG TPA: NAD(P)-dependent oxidoreductase [Planctomycetota bacterium]
MPPSPLHGRRALVLGASGFLGRWVTRELLQRGAHVLAQVRDPARLSPWHTGGAEVLVADLAPTKAGTELLRRASPDVVFNLVGHGVAKDERDPLLYQRLNGLVVLELLFALRGPSPWPGARLVHAGSALEYGEARTLDEQAVPRPGEPYGKSKHLATAAIADMRAHVPAVVARLFTVFGPGERPGRLVPTLVAARGTTERIPLSSGHQKRDLVYVEDAARALVELAELPAETLQSGRYPFDAPCLNLASGALTPVRELVLALADELGIARARLGFGDLPPLLEEMHHPPVPVERLHTALGWTPSRDPRDGLRRLAARLAEGLA